MIRHPTAIRKQLYRADDNILNCIIHFYVVRRLQRSSSGNRNNQNVCIIHHLNKVVRVAITPGLMNKLPTKYKKALWIVQEQRENSYLNLNYDVAAIDAWHRVLEKQWN